MELTVIILFSVIIFLVITVIEQAKQINEMHNDKFAHDEQLIADYKILNR